MPEISSVIARGTGDPAKLISLDRQQIERAVECIETATPQEEVKIFKSKIK